MAIGDKDLRLAGIEIRERYLTKDGMAVKQYQVVDHRKIVSRHVMFSDALKAARARLEQERQP